MAIEIVDLASYNMVDLSSSLCDSLPEGKTSSKPMVVFRGDPQISYRI
jgi:hypothetical protein